MKDKLKDKMEEEFVDAMEEEFVNAMEEFADAMEEEFADGVEVADSELYDLPFGSEPIPEIQRKNRSMINKFIQNFEIDLYDVSFSAELFGAYVNMDFRKCYYMGEFIGYIRIANYPQKETNKPVLGFTEVTDESSIHSKIVREYRSGNIFPY